MRLVVVVMVLGVGRWLSWQLLTMLYFPSGFFLVGRGKVKGRTTEIFCLVGLARTWWEIVIRASNFSSLMVNFRQCAISN